MLRLYFGTDTIGVREAAFASVSELETEQVRVNRLGADSFAPGLIADALGATSLFGEQEVYVLDTPSANADFNAEVIENLAAMAESNNTFVVIEGALLAAQKKPYQKHATDLIEVQAQAAERFNAFGMADALARKDKKSLWLLLQEARMAGLSAEEIIGTLWWQLKTMRLAAQTNSAAEAGLKEFPYKKAKGALQKFTAEEVEQLATSLLLVYHAGHAGERDIDVALERWALAL